MRLIAQNTPSLPGTPAKPKQSEGKRSRVGPESRITVGRAKWDGTPQIGELIKNHGLELKNLSTSPRLTPMLVLNSSD